jgi:ferricrocin synthase
MRHLIADVQSSYLGEVLVSRPTTLETLAVALPADPEPALAFWEAQVTKFADPDAQAFPDMTGVSRSAVQVTGFISSRIPTSIPGERLDNFARSLGGSVGNLLQAAWAVLLSAYLETPLVVFGETLSARLTSGVLESALGPLITATPIPVEVDPSATARSLVERLAHLAMSSATFRQVYLARIRDVLKRRKDQAFFPAMFVVHPEHDGSMDVNEHNELWDIEPDIVPLHAEHGLALNVEMRARSIELDIWADSGRM